MGGNMLGGLDIGSLFGTIIQFKLIGALFGGDLFGGGGGGGMFGGGAPAASTGLDGNMLGAILDSQNDKAFLAALTTQTATVVADGTPSAGSLHNQLLALLQSLNSFVTSSKTDSLVRAIGSGGNNTAVLAIALAG